MQLAASQQLNVCLRRMPRPTANAVVSFAKLATALVVCGHRLPRRIVTVSVADCDDSADFVRNFYDVTFEIAYDVKAAGNI